MSKYIIGQLAELAWKNEGENTGWEYAVLEQIFDDRLQFKLKSGHNYMHILNSKNEEAELISGQPTKSCLTFLYKDGKPVMAKKKLFGGYIVEPR